MINNSI